MELINYILPFFGWIFICTIFNSFWSAFKLGATIKLPKNKKYKDKREPIYKLEEYRWGEGKYQISKYVLDYGDVNWILFLMLLIPYPLMILEWKYCSVGIPYVVNKNIINDNCDIDIESIWEQKYIKDNELNIAIKERQKKQQDCINKINKTFNENYV